VDFASHFLTSLALARGFFPRRAWWFVLGVVLAGTLADVDLVAELFGPGAYLTGRHTYTHSILGTVVVIAIAVGVALALDRKKRPLQKAAATLARTSNFFFLVVAAFAGWNRIAMRARGRMPQE